MVRKLTLFFCVLGMLDAPRIAAGDSSPAVTERGDSALNVVADVSVDERWLSDLTANAALLNNDSAACILRCTELIDATGHASLAGVRATALMQRSCAIMRVAGVEQSKADFDLALASFPVQSSAAMHLQFTQAFCRHEYQLGTYQLRSAVDTLNRELEHASLNANSGVRLEAYCDLLEYKSSLGEISSDDVALFKKLQTSADRDDLGTLLQLLQIRNACNKYPLDVDSNFAQLTAFTEIIAGPDFEHLPRSLRIEALVLAAQLRHANGEVPAATSYLTRARREAEILQNSTATAYCEALSAEIESSGKLWQSCAQRLLAAEPLLVAANNPELIHRFAELFATLPVATTDDDFRAGFSRTLAARLQALTLYRSLSTAVLAKQQTVRVDSILKQQAQQISSEEQNTALQKQRSLRIAQFGVAGFCILVIFLLRERIKLRRVNRRLKDEIRHSMVQQAEREQIELRLAQTERMESLGALAGGVAHDFNNLLVGVMGNADLLRHVDPASPLAKQCLDGIVRSAETAARLSRKMLAYAGKEPSVKAAVDLNSVVERILPLLQAGLGQKHEVRFEPASDSLVTEVDSGQMDQIILNLTSNASQAMANRVGEITIRTGTTSLENIPLDPPTFGNRKVGGEFVWLEVQDTGPGIDPANIARVFEPFFTTKTDSTGHGFGLSVVYGHVNRHDGLVQLTSVVNEGTSFRILLPMCSTNVSIADVQVSPTSTNSGVQEDFVLVVVDDQKNVLDVVQKIFFEDRRKVHAFTSATEAMEFLVDNSAVDCLLLDSMMPVVDGNAMLDELENKGITIPVVMMSGYSTINLSDFQRRDQVKAVVQKPFKPAELQAAVSMAIQAKSGTAVQPVQVSRLAE